MQQQNHATLSPMSCGSMSLFAPIGELALLTGFEPIISVDLTTCSKGMTLLMFVPMKDISAQTVAIARPPTQVSELLPPVRWSVFLTRRSCDAAL